MKKPVFTGAGVAIITPMHADGSVNYAELGRIIDDQIEHGIDAIIICGTTGESATLTHEEHAECIRFAVEHTARRVPVVAGTGSNDTAYAVKLSQHAEEVGADALLLVTPYYNKASQAGADRAFFPRSRTPFRCPASCTTSPAAPAATSCPQRWPSCASCPT